MQDDQKLNISDYLTYRLALIRRSWMLWSNDFCAPEGSKLEQHKQSRATKWARNYQVWAEKIE